MTELVSFKVLGLPKPAGSKTAYLIRRRNGSTGIAMADASGRAGAEWRSAVAKAGLDAMAGQPPCQDPIDLYVTFYMPRPKSHCRSDGTLRNGAPEFHAVRPDATKLVRAVEDALTGIVWADDAQVVRQVIEKRYVDAHHVPGCEVLIYRRAGHDSAS